MSAFRCAKCGSPNHAAYDCSYSGPPPALPPEPDPEPAARDPDPEPVPPPAAEPMFEPEPRWPGAPPLCTAANLLAFDDERQLDEFRRRYAPSCKLVRVWTCEHCGKIHHWSEAPAPAGASSGTDERSKLPEGFTPFVRRRESPAPRQSDLPARPKEELERRAKKTIASPPPPAQDGGCERDLFG